MAIDEMAVAEGVLLDVHEGHGSDEFAVEFRAGGSDPAGRRRCHPPVRGQVEIGGRQNHTDHTRRGQNGQNHGRGPI